LSNNGGKETKELAEVHEVVQLCIKPIKIIIIKKNYLVVLPKSHVIKDKVLNKGY